MENSFLTQLSHEFERPFQNPVLVFSIILFIILLSPLLLRKLKIPGIIGLILSGVVLGPHGLNVLELNSAVKLFSTIGLLYIMFTAGLELDMKEFQHNKNKSLVFGFLTFSIPLVIGVPVCYYFLDYGFVASLLISSMFSTHTMVAYPIVSKFGISKNEAVAVTVGGTILTDTAVLIMLAVILGSNNGGLSFSFWLRLFVSTAIFLTIMFLIIPKITKWFFQKLESEKTSHYIFVLSVVFFAAFLAELAGVEAIIGAFVAGLALNKLIPYSSALMNRIEFTGNALFIPFFLISVGMLVDVSVLLKGNSAIIIAVTLTVVALAGKWIAAGLTSYIFKYSSGQRKLIFGLSSSHAAATLAVIMVGFQSKIIHENALNGTILLILITCLVASLITENASRQILASSTPDTADGRINQENEHILIPIANPRNLEILLEFASFIKHKKSPNPIHILKVVPNTEDAETNLAKARKEIDSHLKDIPDEIKVNIVATIDHNIAGGIIRMSKELFADTILIGWPQKSSVFERFTETKTASLVSRTTRSLYISHFEYPLLNHKRIILCCPPLAGLEHGFRIWLSRFTNLSKVLQATVIFRCDEKTKAAILNELKLLKIVSGTTFSDEIDYSDFTVLQNEIRPEDLLVVVSARRNSISHSNLMENLEEKLDKKFVKQSKVVVYPRTYAIDSKYTEYGEINPESISLGIEKVQKIGRELGGIIKGDRKEKS